MHAVRERCLQHECPAPVIRLRARRLAGRVAALAVAATLALTLLLTLGTRTGVAYSLAPTFSDPVAESSTVAFVGRATADTVRAGRGGVEGGGTGDGHFGRARANSTVHGHVVQVERLAPGLPGTVTAAVRGAGQRVVLVPWDCAVDCRPVPWGPSARWLPITVNGLYQGTLRDRAHWVGNLPALDVFGPQFVPYTGTARDRRALEVASVASSDSALPLLTPDELLGLRATLPTWDAADADPHAAYAPLRAWAAAHPTPATREPAHEMIRSAEWRVADFRFRQRPVPLAGTYRVTIWIADSTSGAGAGDSTTFYARTEDRPSSSLGGYAHAAGMYVLTCATATETALPDVRPPGGCDRATPGVPGGITEGYLAIGDSTWIDTPGHMTRAGGVDVVHGDSAFQARMRRARRRGRAATPHRRAARLDDGDAATEAAALSGDTREAGGRCSGRAGVRGPSWRFLRQARTFPVAEEPAAFGVPAVPELATLQQASGARLWVSQDDADAVASDGAESPYFGPLRFVSSLPMFRYPGARVDRRFADGRLRDEAALDGVMLGGTELPMLLYSAEIAALPVLDTTTLHVTAIVDRLREAAHPAASRPALDSLSHPG